RRPMNELISNIPVSPLRQRLIDDMTMRHFSRETQRNYIRAAGSFFGPKCGRHETLIALPTLGANRTLPRF
ncbi:MAG: hypothetical protein ABJB10_14585, partial [Mesorhizobium sp.]